VDIMSHSTHTGRCFLWKATLQAPAQSGLFILKAPDSPLTTTGRDLSQRRQPQNSLLHFGRGTEWVVHATGAIVGSGGRDECA
jgi:hypothetical protein